MMTKDQCAAVLEQFSHRIKRDQEELAKLKETYRSMFGVDWEEEAHIHRFPWETEPQRPDVSVGQCAQCGRALSDCGHFEKGKA